MIIHKQQSKTTSKGYFKYIYIHKYISKICFYVL